MASSSRICRSAITQIGFTPSIQITNRTGAPWPLEEGELLIRAMVVKPTPLTLTIEEKAMSHQEEQRPLVDFTIRFRRYEEQREYVNDEIVAEISIRAVSQERGQERGPGHSRQHPQPVAHPLLNNRS